VRLGLSIADVDQFLGALASACDAVDVQFFWRPQLRDPEDEIVFEAAINGRADAFLTYNICVFQPAAARFGLRVLTPSVSGSARRIRQPSAQAAKR
jgi:predicted nucleic acid-binding protein